MSTTSTLQTNTITPRQAALWVVGEVERSFKESEDQGNATVRKGCDELRQWIEKEWTVEREETLIEKEKVRWGKTKEEAIGLTGKDKWEELTKQGDEMKDRLERSAFAFRDAFREFEKSKEWVDFSDRMRGATAKAAGKKNVVEASNEAKIKALAVLGDKSKTEDVSGTLASLLRGETTLGSLGEELAMYLNTKLQKKVVAAMEEKKSHHHQQHQHKNEDDVDAFGVVVRFRENGGVANQTMPKTPAEIMVKVSDCAPYCVQESIRLEESMTKDDGAKKLVEFIVKMASTVFSEDRLDVIVDSLGDIKVSGAGGGGGAGGYQEVIDKWMKVITSKDKKGFEKLLKTTVITNTLKLLPQMDLPPIEGVRDGVQYNVKNMDLKHFHVDEKNVRLTMKTTLGSVKRGDPVFKVVVDDVSAAISNMSWEFKQQYFPFLQGQGVAHAKVSGVCVVLGFQLIRRPRSKVHSIVEKIVGDDAAAGGMEEATPASPSPAVDAKSNEDVPQLVLGVCRVTIDNVKIDLQGSSLYSMLTDVFSKTIRTYICSMVQDMIVEKFGSLIERGNDAFATHGWAALSSALEIDTSKFPIEEEAAKRAEQLERPVGGRKDLYSVMFAAEGPMGLVLGKWNEFVVVKSFKRAADGTSLPAEASGKIKIGDILVGFNSGDITSLPLDRVTARISRSRRPLTLSFIPGDAESQNATPTEIKRAHVLTFKFDEEKLFLLIKQRPFEDRAAVVTGFRPVNPNAPPGTPGGEGPAERKGVPVGWVLSAINGQDMLKKTFKDTMAVFAGATARPIELKFVRDPDVLIELNEPPVDLKVASFEGNLTIVSGFSQLKSPAEVLLGDTIQSGDYVIGVGDKDATLSKFDDVISYIKTQPRPVEIRFGRQSVNGVSSAASFGPGPLGIVFYRSSADGKCCFKTFQGVEGPVERTKVVLPGFVLRQVNGVAITLEQHAKELLSKVNAFPCKLAFRDMEAFEQGGWQ